MLIMNSKFVGLPIASIQAGNRVATVTDVIIDPHKLRIMAFYALRTDSEDEDVLFVDDITNFSARGLVIDHDDMLMKDEEDLVRLREVTELNFYLIDKPVETESGAKVGKVSRFAVDLNGFSIMQLYITQPVTVNLGDAEIIVHRNQLVRVTDKKVIVKDAAVKVKARFGIRGLLFGRQRPAAAGTKQSPAKK